jgi:ubiquinol-cytochrome c reductase iron-sulfur subunit
MAVEKERRSFLGAALGLFTAAGGVGALTAMKYTWDPLPSVKAAGFTTVDLSGMQENVLVTEKWRGKPIFILKHSKDMKSSPRDIKVGDDTYFVAIGLCTHLGCIPAYAADVHEFQCACHGGVFDANGEVVKSPPPSPLVIPPFKIEGTKLVLGEEGPEYKKMKADGLVA